MCFPRSRRFPGLILAASAIALGAFAPALALAEEAVFDVSLRGIKGGTLTLSAVENGNAYAASGVAQTTGLVGTIARFRYTAKVKGSRSGERFTPQSYEEVESTSRRESTSTMEYRRGVPVVVSGRENRKPRDWDIDPATQGDAVDPLTALHMTLRAVPEARVCELAVFVFDGHRRSKVTLSNPKRTETGFTCKGEYRRVAGYKPKDMEERTSFPFTAEMAPAGGGTYHVQQITAASLYGTVTMNRR
ncbi:DUF3108 domain-containing protein [Pseudoruegeria sp. SHC-113]|uniref:DUF3108 domain-containing protein n=1 Tax=Pseudoruegeria sp. SHC-113 TaxID=2855439 RepID=UPI0021BA8BE7|nr:DUF3108 domain-containing protein [Pseudoruegeria sp. SHC-113]MCT8161517.1 DUF3108 domain-containing protein [Pseudoruegeria sp. SHC-113]